MDNPQAAPFPYRGGKRRWAAAVWERFGRPDRYLEPFGGSLAMLLSAPTPAKSEVVCERSNFVVNAWRAMQEAPDEVARFANRPTFHADLMAASDWLWEWRERCEALGAFRDLEWYDARAAGLWIWGQSVAIGNEFPLSRRARNGIPTIARSPSGQGVSAQRLTLGEGDDRLVPWFRELSGRLRRVIVLGRDWTAIRSDSVTMRVKSNGPNLATAIFADPPYCRARQDNHQKYGMAAADFDAVAEESYRWLTAPEQGEDRRLRIAFCMHVGDFPVPAGWTKAVKGMMGRRDGNPAPTDCIIFSPHCLDAPP